MQRLADNSLPRDRLRDQLIPPFRTLKSNPDAQSKLRDAS